MWMLLHGFTGSPRSWDSVLAAAALDQDPLRPALFGHGSDWRKLAVTSFDDEVRRLCARLSSERRPRFVAGYSLGARVALGMLASAPELFDGALLVGVHPGLTDEEARRARRNVDAARAELLRTEGLTAFVSDWEKQPLFDTQAELSQDAQHRQREIRLGHEPEGLSRSLELLGLAMMPAHADAIATISVPVTLMSGSKDTKFRGLAEDLARRGRHLDSILVEDAGHNLLLEAPEAVARALAHVERRAGGGAVS